MSATKRIAIIGSGSAYTGQKEPPSLIAEIVGNGFIAEVVEPRLQAFPTTPYDRGVVQLGYVDCAIEAEKAGYDALFINTVGDYGIDEMRSSVDIPVVGAGEATMHLAGTLGRRFSIVTVWPAKMNFIYDERLRGCNMSAKCVSVRNVLSNDEVPNVESAGAAAERLNAREASLVDRVLMEIGRAKKEDHADNIMLGCTCMVPIKADVAGRTDAPVLDAMTCGYKMTETVLARGLAQSRVAFPKPVAANIAAVGQLVSGGELADLSGDCNVCVVPQTAAE